MTSPVTVITGGAGGMGLATARIIGRDHPVIISDISEQQLARATEELTSLGLSCEAYACDITDRAAVDRLAHHASRRGTLVSIVHTAGVSPHMGSAEMIMRINAIGTINVTEAALAHATAGFCLVNVASVAAYMLPAVLVPKRAYRYALTDQRLFFNRMMRRCRMTPANTRPGLAYSLSKNFVVWYSQRMAPRFGETGARILSVSPGSFDTAMGRLEEDAGAGAMVRFGSLPRFGRPEEIAELLAFCASDKPGYLTATDIVCDGGVVGGIRWKDKLTMARAG
jgi:NAD(P)-dependent dehydrogenase (short-subunit alcohol dehydrogenase family)